MVAAAHVEGNEGHVQTEAGTEEAGAGAGSKRHTPRGQHKGSTAVDAEEVA